MPMNTTIISNSSIETEDIAYNVGIKLKGGEVIELVSELGGGKTTFTHGLAKGINSEDKVASPTFTVNKIYNGTKLNIYHYDFYRLNDAELLKYEIKELMINPKNILVIEWPELIKDILPKESIKIEFKYTGEESRNINFTYPNNLSYLISSYVESNN